MNSARTNVHYNATTNSDCSGGKLSIVYYKHSLGRFLLHGFYYGKKFTLTGLTLPPTRFPLSINLFNFTTFRVTRSVEKFLIGSRSGQKACGDHISTANASHRSAYRCEMKAKLVLLPFFIMNLNSFF